MQSEIRDAAAQFSIKMMEAGKDWPTDVLEGVIIDCLNGLIEGGGTRIRCGPVEVSQEDDGFIHLALILDSVVIPYPTGIILSQ